MSSYAGVTFKTRMGSSGIVPEFSSEESPVVTHIPGSNTDDVQFGGRGNLRVTWQITVANLTNYNTLQSAQGATLRTLVKYDGSSVNNVMLLRVGPPNYHKSGTVIFTEAEFMVGT